jgi:hypothetical protein
VSVVKECLSTVLSWLPIAVYPAVPELARPPLVVTPAETVAASVDAVSVANTIFRTAVVTPDSVCPPRKKPALGIAGVTELEAEDAAEVPLALVAVTVNV